MTCDRCGRPASHCAWDEPENDGALMFGDELLGMLLCARCLAASMAEGPWDGVEALT